MDLDGFLVPTLPLLRQCCRLVVKGHVDTNKIISQLKYGNYADPWDEPEALPHSSSKTGCETLRVFSLLQPSRVRGWAPSGRVAGRSDSHTESVSGNDPGPRVGPKQSIWSRQQFSGRSCRPLPYKERRWVVQVPGQTPRACHTPRPIGAGSTTVGSVLGRAGLGQPLQCAEDRWPDGGLPT